MILVDTNIIVDFWKNTTDELKNIFISEDIYICGITKAELLYGARNESEFRKIKNALEYFSEVEIDIDIWDELGRNLFLLKTNGLTVPFQDALLATVALKNNLQIWTNDKHFNFIRLILSDLQLYLK